MGGWSDTEMATYRQADTHLDSKRSWRRTTGVNHHNQLPWQFTTSPVTGVGGGRGAAGDIAYSV